MIDVLLILYPQGEWQMLGAMERLLLPLRDHIWSLGDPEGYEAVTCDRFETCETIMEMQARLVYRIFQVLGLWHQIENFTMGTHGTTEHEVGYTESDQINVELPYVVRFGRTCTLLRRGATKPIFAASKFGSHPRAGLYRRPP
jgi:hypothetical protein